MRLGLIGYPLGHSWSPAIHSYFLKEDCYELWQLEESQLDTFFAERNFDGINVTIPYKQKVMEYLDEIDPVAERMGAVNTIVNQNGKLIGYNTDYLGFADMLKANNIDVKNRKCAVLGSGGVSKAISEGIRLLDGETVIVSRHSSETTITYETLYETEKQYSVLVNATPVGMSPSVDISPIDLTRFTNVQSVVDVIANPLRTKLIFDAKLQGYQVQGGFEMLVRQAAIADRYFAGREVSEEEIQACMNHLLKERRNIVLIGMPTCGKSTIAKVIAERTGRQCIEMDEEIEKILGTTIKQCFAEKGETYFRDIESQLCQTLSTVTNAVISTGGGVIKREKNMQYLGMNSTVYWIQRDIEHLFATSDRPLSQSKEDVLQLFEERKNLYAMYCDAVIHNDGKLNSAVNEIIEKTGE